MSKIIIGIDPDSKAHGVAVYGNKGLSLIQCMPLMSIMLLLARWAEDGMSFDIIEVHIEDVCANNAVFMKPKRSYSGKDLAEVKARSRTLGMCQQSQIELERLFEYYKIKVVRHKISKMWKKDKSQFEKITGWKSQSNEDTRSAAYFGWLGLNK
jgi:hypothetical protein